MAFSTVVVKRSMHSNKESAPPLSDVPDVHARPWHWLTKIESVEKKILTNSLKEIISFISLRDMYFRSKQQISRRQIILKNKNVIHVNCKRTERAMKNGQRDTSSSKYKWSCNHKLTLASWESAWTPIGY